MNFEYIIETNILLNVKTNIVLVVSGASYAPDSEEVWLDLGWPTDQ